MQAVQTVVAGEIKMKCEKDWDPCQKQQACIKVKHMDALAKSTPGGLARLSKLNPTDYAKKRSQGNYYAKKYIQPQNAGEAELIADCMKYEPNNAQRVTGDHLHDIGYGGDPKGPLAMMESSVNAAMGGKVGNTSPQITHATGFSMDCC